MTRTNSWAAVLGLCALIVSVGSCGERTPTGIAVRPSASEELLETSLLACPAKDTGSTVAIIGTDGGTLSVGPALVQIPAGALLQRTTISVTVPQSPYLDVDIHAVGYEHFLFAQPITVVLDYSQCGVSLWQAPMGVSYVDDAYTTLEQMTATDVRLLDKVVFSTGHLSGYAIAQ